MKKILFIEDEQALQRAATQVFHEEGFDVLSATDGEGGVRAAKAELPDLILLDLVLPKKHGLDVIRELKADPATARIPIFVLSNLSEETDVEKAIALGAEGYLLKTNYQLEEIVQKVKQALEK